MKSPEISAYRDRSGCASFQIISPLMVLGIFLMTLATLMDEILLTRIFSVTTWYHFAFGAISLAMFGMTVGALRVYQNPDKYVVQTSRREMAASSFWFAVTAIVSEVLHLLVPFASQPALALLWIACSYCLFALPFYFSGVCVCLALTKFPRNVGMLYAADLLGAGMGCVAIVIVLKFVDAPTAIVAVGFLGGVSSLIFAIDARAFRRSQLAFLLVAGLACLVSVSVVRQRHQSSPLLRITWAKGRAEPIPLYEKWNSFSRIAVDGEPTRSTQVVTEGISPIYPAERRALQLHLRIDGGAETTITSWKRLEDLDYLQYDVKNIVHHIRSNGSVLIIGAGGGRDVLAALLMGQKAVRAVEINPSILTALNGKFGDFAGHLDRNPKITFVNDEARSYIARCNERFDVIEASFIDTWAATAAGALTLTENSLYTIEAWRLFLRRLSPDGVLSFSRWYSSVYPGETYRLVSLAAAALRSEGVGDTRSHILLVHNLRSIGSSEIGAATILVSKAGFSDEDVKRLKLFAEQMQFTVDLSPGTASDPTLVRLANGELDPEFVRSSKLNLSPPTDDSPFFFYLKPLRYAFQGASSNATFTLDFQSGEIVLVLLALVILLTFIFVLLPLYRDLNGAMLRASAMHLLFFAAIGMGFMLVEVSQMQRLIIFLGHPTYALSVVLFTLLVSSGVGSYSTRRDWGQQDSAIRIALLLLTLMAFGILSAPLITYFASATTPMRIMLSFLMLAPAGFFMGMAFPLGLKLAISRFDSLMPAFWGLNGAASICASILAMVIAMNLGVSMAFWSGFACYVLGSAALFSSVRTGIIPVSTVRVSSRELQIL